MIGITAFRVSGGVCVVATGVDNGVSPDAAIAAAAEVAATAVNQMFAPDFTWRVGSIGPELTVPGTKRDAGDETPPDRKTDDPI